MRFLLLLLLACITTSVVRPAGAQTPQAVETAFFAEGVFRAIDVRFEPGQSVLPPSAIPVLDAVSDVLRRHPGLYLEIAGHTDETGSEFLNVRLSEDRAHAVRTYLVARHGIDPGRLTTKGYGESLPIASNRSSAGRGINRRVEFRVIAAATPPPVARRADPDSLRDALRRQIEEAVRSALPEQEGPSDDELERLAELEKLLQDRLALVESRLTGETAAAAAAAPAARFGVLPLTGIYLRSDLPVVVGLRLDIPTSLLWNAHFQPEAAIGFRPDDNAAILNANMVFPIRIAPAFSPYFGTGFGLHNLDRMESVLNLTAGAEYLSNFGVLYAELMTQDFGDFNRIVVGFRQDF